MAQMNMIQSLNSAMDVMLARDPNVVVLGQDVGFLRWRVPRHRRPAAQVRRAPRARHPDRRRRDRRRRDRHGRQWLASRRRSAVRRLHLSGLRPDLQRTRTPALSQRRRFLGTGDDPHAVRRWHSRRPDAFAKPGRHFHARLRHQGRDAFEPVRRQRTVDRLDRGRRPGRVLRAEASLQRSVRRRSQPSPRCRGARTRKAKCPTVTTRCRSARPRSCARARHSRS